MRASRSGNIWQNVDWLTIGMFLALAIFGWINIYGASYTFDQTSIVDFSNRAGKQFAWIIGSLLLGFVLLMIDYKTYDVLAYIAYGAMLLLLLATPFLAHDIKGSMSWISLGPVNLQPAEFAKCIVALAIAKYMGRYEYKLRTWRDLIVPFAIIGVPALIGFCACLCRLLTGFLSPRNEWLCIMGRGCCSSFIPDEYSMGASTITVRNG